MFDTIENQIKNRCIHFDGIQHEKCKAGVTLKGVKDTFGKPHKWPCLRNHMMGGINTCDLVQFPSEEEVKEEANRIRKETTKLIREQLSNQ